MIQRPKNWDSVQEFYDRPKLPLDAYVCRVKQVSFADTNYGPQLLVLFDIEEGEQRGFFSKEFKANTMQDKKWKGVIRQFLPKDDGTDNDEWTKSSFKGLTTAFEHSNPGYTWNWEETSLVGKLVGILFRNEEWSYNGKTGWTVRPFRAMSADRVRSGEYILPPDKPLKKAAAPSNGFAAIPDNGPLPWDNDSGDGPFPF